MATNFPYFKFTSGSWLTGDIVFEDLETQGLFINICAIYWHRDGQITIADIEKRFSASVEKAKLSDRLAKLTDRFISVSGGKAGKISIKFLDDQLLEISQISAKNSENGKKGGRPKELNINDKKAKKTQKKRPLSEIKRPPSNKEEEEEKEEEKNINRAKSKNFIKPELSEIKKFFFQEGSTFENAETFFNHFESNGWLIGGKTKMKNWQAAAKNWIKRSQQFNNQQNLTKKNGNKPATFDQIRDWASQPITTIDLSDFSSIRNKENS